MVVGRGTGDEPDGNSISRAEEIGDEGDGVEEEGAGGREEGYIGAAAPRAWPDSERMTSANVRPFRRGRHRA